MKIRTGIEKLGKGMILLIFSIFTIFPFVWMILSALKTKAELMDVRSFFPAEFQWHNFYQVIFESPLLRYVGNSLFVSVITLALQIVYASDSSNIYSELYYSGKLESAEHVYRADHFQLCQHFRNLSASTGIYAGSNGTDRGSKNRRGKLLEDFVAGRVSDDKIFVHHIWTDELYYLLQQLYVAFSDHRCG